MKNRPFFGALRSGYAVNDLLSATSCSKITTSSSGIYVQDSSLNHPGHRIPV